jgi:hypothetical protein
MAHREKQEQKVMVSKTSFIVDTGEPYAVHKQHPDKRVSLDSIGEKEAEWYDVVDGKPVHVHSGQRFLSTDGIVQGREALFEEEEQL